MLPAGPATSCPAREARGATMGGRDTAATAPNPPVHMPGGRAAEGRGAEGAPSGIATDGRKDGRGLTQPSPPPQPRATPPGRHPTMATPRLPGGPAPGPATRSPAPPPAPLWPVAHFAGEDDIVFPAGRLDRSLPDHEVVLNLASGVVLEVGDGRHALAPGDAYPTPPFARSTVQSYAAISNWWNQALTNKTDLRTAMHQAAQQVNTLQQVAAKVEGEHLEKLFPTTGPTMAAVQPGL